MFHFLQYHGSMDLHVSETSSESSDHIPNLDLYNFYGCHISGGHYQEDLDYHVDVCLKDDLSIPQPPSALYKRAQSMPADLNKFCGSEYPTTPSWISNQCMRKSFSHYCFHDPKFEPYFEPYQIICSICQCKDHEFQHSFDELEHYNNRKANIPDSISTNTIPETVFSTVLKIIHTLVNLCFHVEYFTSFYATDI